MSSTIVAGPLAGNVLGSESAEFVIAEWRDAGGPPEPPRYLAPLPLHHSDDEAWYVLEGKQWVRSGDEIVEASAGAAVFVPRGTPHTYWNPTAGLTRYLLVMTSRTHRMIQQIHMLTDRSLPSMRPLFQNYDSELL